MTLSVSGSSPTSHLALDSGLAGALVAALLVVFVVDRLRPVGSDAPSSTQVVEVVEPPVAIPARALRLGITPEHAQYDDMGKLLQGLGGGYKYRSFSIDDLLDPARLADFDIVFLTCSGYTPKWLNRNIGGSSRGGDVFTPNEDLFAEAKRSLRTFVGQGGTLYASDLHFELIANCFPEFVDKPQVNASNATSVDAEVVDAGLRELIGPRIELNFDLPGWRPAAFAHEALTVYLRGAYMAVTGDESVSPLLVKFPFKEGNVIFTSFHNEKQNNEAEVKLLRYLVFAAVTANVESQITKTMTSGGFARAKQNLFSTSSRERAVTQTYDCTRAADLQFVLGFQNQGARLRLTVTAPDGRAQAKEGVSTITIDIPKAALGVWKYTVTAVDVPNENFPFTVTVGQK